MISHCTIQHQSGISYVEVLVAVIIIALSIIPVSNAIRGGLQGASIDVETTANHFRLVGKLEEVLAEPFATLNAQAAGTTLPTAYSDPVNTVDRRLVYIAGYDGDNADADNDPFTGADDGLLFVRVEIATSSAAMQALRTDQ